jgi:hypothetical protein
VVFEVGRDGYVTNWKSFNFTHGVPGVANLSTAEIDLTARGTAWAMLWD